MKTLINVGCGYAIGKSWHNFDASPSLYFEKIPILGNLYTINDARFPTDARCGDIVKKQLCTSNSADAVFCSHMLEHVSLEECKKAIGNIYSMLKTGGCFRLIVPDLNYFALQYIDNPNIDGAHKFMKDSGLGIERPAVSMFEKLRRAIGFSRHLWMYDEKTLTFELERVGFMKIRRCVFGDAQIPEFSEVEDRGRFENCLAIECFK